MSITLQHIYAAIAIVFISGGAVRPVVRNVDGWTETLAYVLIFVTVALALVIAAAYALAQVTVAP